MLYDGKKYMLSKGSCVFIDCLPAYSHVTSDNLWKLGWVHFNGPEMGNIYEKYKSRGGLVCFQSQKNYSQILDSLYAVSKSSSHVRDMEINSLLSQLLVYLMEDSWNPENKENRGKRSKVVAVKQYIDENFSKHITLDELSSLFFMNKTYLSEMFKEQYGVPVNDYLISVRTTEAKKLLRFTAMTMEEIAEAIGVNGAAYFSRMFKKVEGCSPSEYRAMW